MSNTKTHMHQVQWRWRTDCLYNYSHYLFNNLKKNCDYLCINFVILSVKNGGLYLNWQFELYNFDLMIAECPKLVIEIQQKTK